MHMSPLFLLFSFRDYISKGPLALRVTNYILNEYVSQKESNKKKYVIGEVNLRLIDLDDILTSSCY